MLEQLLQTLLLGLIQGISEWLPISSTAHLKLAGYFLGLEVTPMFNIILHLGTLIVVIFFFRKEIKKILAALTRLDFKSESGMLIPRIIVASITTAAVSIAYILLLRDTLSTLPFIAVTFLIGATMVYSTKFAKETANSLPYKTAILMGLAQGLAIFPGLSRSGITISTALLLSQKRKHAFRFSFLLSIPAIIGDFIVETYIVAKSAIEGEAILTNGLSEVTIFVGVIGAVIAGYLSLKLVSKAVQGRKFHYFAYYTWTLGIALLILIFGFNI